jgi:general secretion pathway protein C
MLKLAGVATAAAFAANAFMTTLVTQWVYDVEPAAVGVAAEDDNPEAAQDAADDRATLASASTAEASPSRAAQDILSRNLFCPTCVDTPDEAPAQPTTPAPATATPLVLRLVATMESTNPRYSLATIYNPQTETTGVFGMGDTVVPGVIVTGVGAGVLAVDAGGQAQLLRIGESPAQPVATPSRPAPATSRATRPPVRAKTASASSLPGAADAIECPSEGLCVVEREFVESLLQNPAALARQAVVRPNADGFALARVSSGSLPALLGFQTGDVLTEVNGEALDSIDKAFALFTKLRNASNLEVTVRRKGQTVRKQVQIS